ncbi:MAG: hypothetical protein SA339_02260 [Methanomassiliicoccus sp.]|nr:hypothetical protein [Methanomassiliicoccus sp.]
MAAMVILAALLASWVVGTVQGSKVAYVAVRADKTEYNIGENVTFSLVPLSQDVQFTVTGDYGQSGVYIVRLPDNIDPDTYLDDPNVVSNLSHSSHGNGVTAVPIPQYNSTGEPLRLSWNGTIESYNDGSMKWDRATAGYYLLYPVYSWQYGHSAKFMLERASIFHLDGLSVRFNISLDSSVFTIRTDLYLPQGSESMTGLFTTIVPNYSYSFNTTTNYHNETLELRPGETTTVTITYPGQDSSYEPVTTSMFARFIVGDTAYTFGFSPYIVYNNDKMEVHYGQF